MRVRTFALSAGMHPSRSWYAAHLSGSRPSYQDLPLPFLRRLERPPPALPTVSINPFSTEFPCTCRANRAPRSIQRSWSPLPSPVPSAQKSERRLLLPTTLLYREYDASTSRKRWRLARSGARRGLRSISDGGGSVCSATKSLTRSTSAKRHSCPANLELSVVLA